MLFDLDRFVLWWTLMAVGVPMLGIELAREIPTPRPVPVQVPVTEPLFRREIDDLRDAFRDRRD
ncbi:MAG: hypothetical protein INR70_23380 [Parafilimonas terrae]|nr:hypothetical protein [Parafilimonas terrae]